MPPKDLLIDKSALIHGVSKYLERKIIYGNILIHKRLLSEIEKDAREGLVTAEIALDEIKRLRDVSESLLVSFEIVGDLISRQDTNDELREYCLKRGCTIVTADEIQKQIAENLGIDVFYLSPLENALEIESYFDENTMSVHLKEGTTPKAKRGKPGYWQFVELSSEITSGYQIKKLVSEILASVKYVKDSFIEIERKGSTIVQLGNYRVIITHPPLSDGWEVTITRPVTRKKLEDYNLHEKLMNRLKEHAEGILIAGSPGMGKTTFAQALAEFYNRMGKVVKTIESPRDMHLPPEITQYSKNYAEVGELHDILLLSRPDYTVYDEMRNDEDFKLYIDLRLAGIGMIGVVHATSPIDAIHRFINRVDIGTIPNILDTVIFIHAGNVAKVYSLDMTVKVPTGLREADLARPVVEVKDLIEDKVEYEIYVFGEQTMLVPVGKIAGNKQNAMQNKLERVILNVIPNASVTYENGEYVITIPKEEIGKFNKKLVSKLKRYEKKHGIRIRVKFDTS
ncbi:PINc/VapC family ATPase [Sulfurisphaera tokodaii]|uniref:ATPase n=2 Tax=Sulfurisphaera tokodaii TaxID=111955 RepID=F9VND4_SULTO|nr:PINc/VapC family ATPase [Sulfurisphaera tokodaii]BAK54580.1 ATPase [Sulfurisphaera tokodaii str. 7]HII73672.1 Flp pilus assembly complex ATPase component TadA [Sulfurisphaera tokodaii]